MSDLSDLILSATQIHASQAATVVPDRPGYYAIWVDDQSNLPGIYAERLQEQQTRLIYVGIATRSLLTRLVRQDLYHKSPSTFFRGIGAVLGYRPPRGSLAGKRNQNNYTFCASDTRAIITWIESHLQVSAIEEAPASSRRDADAIARLCPLLNSDHNPRALRQLAQVRLECREIARSTT